MKILIKNGRLLNPATGTDSILSILTDESLIRKISASIDDAEADQIIDASGCYVMPGLIDMHVHLRDPGQIYKETLETGAKAAAKGGFTTIVAMANTSPVIDDQDKLTQVYQRAGELSPINILQAAAVTFDMQGKELTDFAGLKEAGAPALSEDGKSVMDAALFRQALERAAEYDLPVLDHCEDISLKGNGVFHLGSASKQLNVAGIPASAEDTITARDILLAKETGAHLHICHCSTAASAKIIKLAKQDGIHVTAEVCPHHFTLSDADIVPDDSNFKMAPPLRPAADVSALIKGLQNGTLDVITSDHAPHAAHEKTSDVTTAAFGIVGLETSVALTISELVKPGYLTPLQMAEKMSYTPARILNIPKGDLSVGNDADITIIDPDTEYTIDRSTFMSKSHNTPFHGRKVQGAVKATICGGNIVYTA